MSNQIDISETGSISEVLVSIVITSYNYERFISKCINSALKLDWPNLEVIVVDDGSSDGSRKIIEGFGSEITAIFQSNQGRVSATNVGFSHSKGDFVIFLDSDDMLDSRIIREVCSSFSDKTSKIQCQMIRVDEEGSPFGSPMPQYPQIPSAELIKKWYYKTATYPTPQGSGNVYSRKFLNHIFPLDGSVWDSSDSCCLAAAPYYGNIETVAKILVYYRVHGKNASLMTNFDVAITSKELLRFLQRHRYAGEIARSINQPFEDKAIFRSIPFSANRLISFRFARNYHPVPNDSLLKILIDGVAAPFHQQGYSKKSATILTIWFVCVGLLPKQIAQQLVLLRYVPSSRPRRFIRRSRS